MVAIKNISQIKDLPDGNRVVGNLKMQNATVAFSGKNNVLYCDGNVFLKGSYLHFAGDDSVIWLGSTRNPYNLKVELYNDSVFHIGKNNFINSYMPCFFKLSEQKHIFIGNDCLFSYDVSFRTADPHLVYDANTKKRINYSKSIFVGDHVWIGQTALLLKGTQIHSGSIIGSMAVLAGKEIPHQTSWGGNPVKKLRDDIYWKRDCVHNWKESETEEFSQMKEEEISVLNYDSEQYISFDYLDSSLTAAKGSDEKIKILEIINKQDSLLRFVEPPIVQSKKSSFFSRLFRGNK